MAAIPISNEGDGSGTDCVERVQASKWVSSASRKELFVAVDSLLREISTEVRSVPQGTIRETTEESPESLK
jgi:hypothetical protein